MGLGITELIRRCGGDDAVVFQNVLQCMRGAKLIDKGRATEISIGVDASIITATEIMRGDEKKIGLVIWLDKATAQKALADWKAEQSAAAP